MTTVARKRLAGPLRCLIAAAFAVAAGCHREPSANGDQRVAAKDCVDRIDTIHDDQQLADAEQELYSYGSDGVQAISGALRMRSYRSKLQMLQVLSAIPDVRTPVLLIDELSSPTAEYRRQALLGLSLFTHPPLGNPLFPHLESKVDSDREWTLYTFTRWKVTDAKPAFLAAAKDPNPDIRMQAARGLRLYPGPDSIQLLQNLMDDKASGVAAEAMISLERIDPNNAKALAKLASLSPSLRRASVNDKEELAAMLGECRSPRAETMLATMLLDPDPRIRSAALGGYIRLGKPRDAKPVVRRLETDIDPGVKARAAQAAAKLDLTEAIPVLRKMVFVRERNTARLAARALKEMGDPLTTGVLIGMTKVPDLEIRRMGAVGEWRMSIGKADYFAIVDEILVSTRSDSVLARLNATEYLGDLPGPQFAARLAEMQHDPDASVRVAAMDALKRQMGMPPGIPPILEHPKPSWVDSPR